MGVEDGFLRSTRPLRKRVTREIRRIRPQLIICADPARYLVGDSYINHPDHRNAGLVALDAIFPAADNPMFYPDMADEGYLPHKISQLYVYGHPESNVTINVTADIEQKIEAILCHKSQFTEPEKMREWFLKRTDDVDDEGNKRYVERFKGMWFD